MKLKLPERRRFVRIETPLKLLIRNDGSTDEVITKNVSPVGLRFETKRSLEGEGNIEMELYLPSFDEPIKLLSKLVWQTRTSLEDNSPFDVGVEIIEIDDKNKNVFLKYLCDLLYRSTYKARI